MSCCIYKILGQYMHVGDREDHVSRSIDMQSMNTGVQTMRRSKYMRHIIHVNIE
jgi:hypothetical protein